MSVVKGVVRLLVPAASAKPSPAIGQALGPLGVNMMEATKAFNARTESMKEGIPVPIVLTAMSDRSFDFVVKTPQTSWLIKKAAGIEKGSSNPGSEVAGSISLKEVFEIAKIKHKDEHMHHIPLRSMCKLVMASAKSMGVDVTRR